MSEFSEYIKKPKPKKVEKVEKVDEAVKATKKKVKKLREATNIERKNKVGKAPADLLRAFYKKFKDREWSTSAAKPVKKKIATGIVISNLQATLVRTGYLVKTPNGFKITQQGLDYLAGAGSSVVAKSGKTIKQQNKNDEKTPKGINDGGESSEEQKVAKGIRDVAKLKKRKFKVPKLGKNSKYLDQMKKILSHMKGFAKGTVKTTYMLAGDPGTGKTSFIRSLSTLTGIPLVVIEAPHITQEHLINIPFLVIDGPKEKKGNLVVDDSQSQLKVVQAESNLITRLKSKRKRTDQQIQQYIKRNKILRDIQPQLLNRINKITNSYNSILFLDEFYRTSSMKIRNVLRNILNGKIGNDKIPKGVYIIMATNIDDEGVDDIPLNQHFHLMDYDVSSKDDFMSYMYGKYIEDPEAETTTDEESEETENYGIEPEIWNSFMDNLTDTDLGFNDTETDVRLSPRRLEQMLIYINAALPVKDAQEAKRLMGYVKINLSNYLEEVESPLLYGKFAGITLDLIKKTNKELGELDDVDIITDAANRSTWVEQLEHQVQMKLKLGEDRTYVPVVSGDPGIGKTTQMVTMSEKMQMGFIQVDVSNLTPEDITGMPIANMEGQDNITTEFSDPNLYIGIMKEYNMLKQQHPEYFSNESRKYNVILLFDEMNRTTIPVFNSIRKVLLEKSFDDKKLPEDIMITGAINPRDVGESVVEFTSHTRDVLDIIPSSGNFTKTMAYIRDKEELVKISNDLGFDVLESVAGIMTHLALEFKSEVDNEENVISDIDLQPFWWSDGSQVFYVSPREMTECVANTVSQLEDVLEDDMNYNADNEYTDEEYNQFIDECINTTAKSFVDSFKMITLKQEVGGFIGLFGKKILGNEKYRKMFDNIKEKVNMNRQSIYDLLFQENVEASYFGKQVVGTYIDDHSDTEMNQDISNVLDRYTKDFGSDFMGLFEATLNLTSKLLKSFEKVQASNNYSYTLSNYIGKRLAEMMKNMPPDNFMSMLDNDKMMKKLEEFTK